MLDTNEDTTDRQATQREIDRLKNRVAYLEAEQADRDRCIVDGQDVEYRVDSKGGRESCLPFIPSKRAGDDLTLKGDC